MLLVGALPSNSLRQSAFSSTTAGRRFSFSSTLGFLLFALVLFNDLLYLFNCFSSRWDEKVTEGESVTQDLEENLKTIAAKEHQDEFLVSMVPTHVRTLIKHEVPVPSKYFHTVRMDRKCTKHERAPGPATRRDRN